MELVKNHAFIILKEFILDNKRKNKVTTVIISLFSRRFLTYLIKSMKSILKTHYIFLSLLFLKNFADSST